MATELAELSFPQWMGTAGFTNPNQQWCTQTWGFHTVWGGIDSGGRRFFPRFVGVVHVRYVGYLIWEREMILPV